jgi:1-acyl-sn-glycerol-3-phosphate acyltransferase
LKDRKQKKKWIKPRHTLIRNLAYLLLTPYIKLKYRVRIERFREQEKRPYLILMNHQTPFDQFFVGIAFRGPVYYLATEDIFSNGIVSKLLRYAVAPIPIKKQTVDVKAVMNCVRVVREGGTLCIAPEGNRTYSGQTEYMNPSIASMAKKLKLPVALFRIEGGYGAQPRWSNVVRRGKVTARVSRVISPEETAAMTEAELFEVIRQELYVNEANTDVEFHHKKRAEYLERVIYVCPECGLSEFHSEGAFVECKKCRRKVEYLPSKELRGVGFDLPFRFVLDWYEYQKDFVSRLDLSPYTEEPLYRDTVDFYRVIPSVKKELIQKRVELSLYGDRVCLKGAGIEMLFPFDSTEAFTLLGRKKMNIYFGDTIYQVKGSDRFNSLKYLNLYYRYHNVRKGVQDEQFLGI